MISERTSFPPKRAGLGIAALAALATGCLLQDEGIVIEVNLVPHPGGAALDASPVRYRAGAPRGTVTDRGFDVVVRQALITVDRIELLPCDEVAGAQLASWRGWLKALHPVSTARAHGPSSPTLINEPQILNLMEADHVPWPVSFFTPPPGDYCGVRVTFAPADPHANGIEAHPELLGWTAWVAGDWVGGGHEQPQPFRWRLDDMRSVELPLVDSQGRSQRLGLSSSQQQASLVLSLGYGMACDAESGAGGAVGQEDEAGAPQAGSCRGLFDQVDLSDLDPSPVLLDNLAANLRAVVCLAHSSGACTMAP